MRILNNTLDLIEMDLMKREWVGVFVVDVDGESAAFAVSHQIADVYDQAHGSDRCF